MIIKQKRDQEKAERYFFAAIQGIDLAKNDQQNEDERLKEVKRRAAARLAGGEEELETQTLTSIGFKVRKVKE